MIQKSKSQFYIYKSVQLVEKKDLENSKILAVAIVINDTGIEETINIYYPYVAEKIINGILTRLSLWEHGYIKLLMELCSKDVLMKWSDNYSELIPPSYIQENFLTVIETTAAIDHPEFAARQTLKNIQKDIAKYREMLNVIKTIEIDKIETTA